MVIYKMARSSSGASVTPSKKAKNALCEKYQQNLLVYTKKGLPYIKKALSYKFQGGNNRQRYTPLIGKSLYSFLEKH